MSLNRLKELAGIVTEAKVDMDSIIYKFLDVNKIFSFEGPSGVRKFEKLIRALDPQYKTLEDFLEDNPGAFDALIDFIINSNVNEWVDNLKAELPQEEDD